jgi:dolichol-phosphate mannosyltransferase
MSVNSDVDQRSRRPLVSVVVPCYNEAEALPITHERLRGVLESLPDVDFEIVYVNDGSSDATFEILRALCAHDPRVRAVDLSRNFGHQIAVTAGIDCAKGDAVVLIDADLQDPPEVIRDFLARWRQGYQVAYGVRTDRPSETFLKLWTARAFYRILGALSDTTIPMDTGDFRLMDRRVVRQLQEMPERHRFVRGMVAWVGFRQVAVPYRRDARVAGVSKYPLVKMLRFALDGVTSFSILPLRLAMWMGFAAAGAALAGICYALFVRFFTRDWVSGWAGLFIGVLFMGGVQLISIGVMGEYVGRIYTESKRRPLYIIAETLGAGERHPDA